MPLCQDMLPKHRGQSKSKKPRSSICAAARLPLLCAVTDLLSCFFHLRSVAKGTNRKRILSIETKAKHENKIDQTRYTVP